MCGSTPFFFYLLDSSLLLCLSLLHDRKRARCRRCISESTGGKKEKIIARATGTRGRRSRCFLLLCLRPSTSKKKKKHHRRQLWRLVSKTVLSPSHPFSAHRLLHEACYSNWDRSARGPPPLWTPDEESGGGGGARDTNLARMMATLSDPEAGRRAAFRSSEAATAVSREWDARATGCPLRDYDLLHRVSVSEPEFFWPRALRRMRVDFATAPLAALGRGGGSSAARWAAAEADLDNDYERERAANIARNRAALAALATGVSTAAALALKRGEGGGSGSGAAGGGGASAAAVDAADSDDDA